MQRRKQNSSCDECRKARIGCDALSNPGSKCFNCKRTNRPCTLEWIRRRASQLGRRPRSGRSRSSGPATSTSPSTLPEQEQLSHQLLNNLPTAQNWSSTPLGLEQAVNHRQQAVTLHEKLSDIFDLIFESRLSLWMSEGCCPYKNSFKCSAPKPTLTQLFAKLDSNEFSIFGKPISENSEGDTDLDNDNELINQALSNAVRAFSIRWLGCSHEDFKHEGTQIPGQMRAELPDSLWQQARQSMYSIMSRPSYRSILALQIFGMTPIPKGNGDKRTSDLCIEIALNQQRSLQSTGRATHLVYASRNSNANHTSAYPLDQMTQRRLSQQSYMQDLAFWFSVSCDTARCLMKSRPSVLFPDGTGDSKVWDYVKHSNQDFDLMARHLRDSRAPLSDEFAGIVLQHASAAQKMFWSDVVRFQQSLYQQEQDVTKDTLSYDVFQQLEDFDEVYGAHLDHCERDFMFLNGQNQLAYFLVSLHHHLAVLMLIDSLGTTMERMVIRRSSHELRSNSCRAIVNAAKLALPPEATEKGISPQSGVMLFDPNPDSVVLALSRAGTSLLMLYDGNHITSRTVETTFPVIFRSLEAISQISHTASHALLSLKRTFSKVNLNDHRFPPLASKAEPDYIAFIGPNVSQGQGTLSNQESASWDLNALLGNPNLCLEDLGLFQPLAELGNEPLFQTELSFQDFELETHPLSSY